MTKPWWWNKEYSRFQVQTSNKGRGILLMNDMLDMVNIQRHQPYSEEWELRCNKTIPGHFGGVNFVLFMPTEILKSAFGLTKTPVNEPNWSKRFDAECSVDGCYIRVGHYLNLPGPGTGGSRDLNLSILLNKQIVEAVESLLSK